MIRRNSLYTGAVSPFSIYFNYKKAEFHTINMYICRRDNTIRMKISREVQYYRTGIVILIKANRNIINKKENNDDLF
jgi:hypothetical protein